MALGQQCEGRSGKAKDHYTKKQPANSDRGAWQTHLTPDTGHNHRIS